MLLDRVISFAKRLEDPKHPLLGPNLKGLYLFGLWQTGGSRFRNVTFNIIYTFYIVFVCSQITELYIIRYDLNKALSNFSLTALSAICCVKRFSCVLCNSKWYKLVNKISFEEVMELEKQNSRSLTIMTDYKRYTRFITYMYWLLVAITESILIGVPLMAYLASDSYRHDIKMGVEPYPQILSVSFPFNHQEMPGYLFGTILQITMTALGAVVIAMYDTTAVAVMTFLKGQMILLKHKCAAIFECETESYEDFMLKIKECHRHHNFLIEQYKLFDSLLSPVMFIYVLVCSITICCSVVQFNLEGITFSRKLWVVQYTIAQISQLFLFCWHGNEVLFESTHVDQGVYASQWWRADVRMRQQVLLLAGKLNRPMYLNAGPFTSLTLPTFVNIMKGSYSFFTLFTQIQE